MADHNSVLTIDLGSSGLRTLLADEVSPWVVEIGAERKYRTYRPRNKKAISAKFQPRELRTRVLTAIEEASSKARRLEKNIVSIAITAQRGGSAFISSDGHTIYIGPNTDLRAIFQGATIDQDLGHEVYAQTGHLPSFLGIPAKLHWWRAHHPRISSRIASVCTIGSWLGYQLTGELAEVPTTLGEVGLLNISSRSIPHSLLSQLNIDSNLIPTVIDEGTATGRLRREIADLTGLDAGIPVYLSGPDSQVALMGMGVINNNDIGIPAGWSAPVQLVTTKPILDESDRATWAGLHVMGDKWVAEANTGDTGASMDIVRNLIGRLPNWDRVNNLMAQSREGANLITAFWGPHALNLSDPGITMGGLLAPVPISHNPISSSLIIRATIENIIYAIREAIELVHRVTGGAADRRVSVTGRMGSNVFFSQILANVLNTTITNHGPFATATGATVIASRPKNEWTASAQEIASKGVSIEPDVRGVMEYSDLFPRWQRLRKRLDSFFDEL